jgi:hypothetical protein
MRHEVETSYTLIDIQQSIILVFMMLLALIFTLVKLEQNAKDKAINSPGDIIVQLFWENEKHVDLDLWIKAPGDQPVGYSNPSSVIFNLLRDDLGLTNDISGINEEVAYTRGKPDGEYIINVHSFSGGPHPTIAKIIVSKRTDSRTVVTFWTGTFEFKSNGIEHTFIRFYIKDGVVNSDYNFVQHPLRSKP